MRLPFPSPLEPMLAKLSTALPSGDTWLFEPKWDGFRAIIFRDGDELLIQSRDLKPLDRYFPELRAPLLESLPERCVVDGEVVIAGARGLDFDALLLRIHPAASRVALLSKETPASFIAWDLMALGDEDLRGMTQAERRTRLEAALGGVRAPIHLTPCTRDSSVAKDWFDRFEGAGLDGVIAKPLTSTYQPGKRTMLKIKHARTADCVVAGFRWYRAALTPEGVYKDSPGTLVGSLLLGIHDAEGVLHHVGVTSSFTKERRAELVTELEPLRAKSLVDHPWKDWAAPSGEAQRRPGATSRWNRGKDLSWEPLRIELVAEVAYDHLQGTRFRHATTFRRFRTDKQPRDCRYDQLEETAAYELAEIFAPERQALRGL